VQIQVVDQRDRALRRQASAYLGRRAIMWTRVISVSITGIVWAVQLSLLWSAGLGVRIAITALALILAYVNLVVDPRIAIARAIRQTDRAAELANLHLLTERSWRITNAYTFTEMDWSSFIGAVERPGQFLFLITPRRALTLPTGGLPAPELATLREFVAGRDWTQAPAPLAGHDPTPGMWITVPLTYNADRLRAAFAAVLRPGLADTRWKATTGTLILLCAVAPLALVNWRFILLGAMPVIHGGYAIVRTFSAVDRSSRHMSEPGREPGTLTLSDLGLHGYSARRRYVYRWEYFVAAFEMPGQFVLMIDSTRVASIPNTDMRTDDLDVIRNFLANRDWTRGLPALAPAAEGETITG
jgi:hypothetical protein